MILLALLLAIAPEPAPDCHYDRAAMLALSEEAFDQDFKGGWRALDERGCFSEAADLIRDYRNAAPRANPSILSWHEGQERAFAGDYNSAVPLFEASRLPVAKDKGGWNFYVDGSIAFLRYDRTALETARAKLAGIPKPKNLPVWRYHGHVVPSVWPANLNVLDGLRKCFTRPYREAYNSEACTAPAGRIEIND